MKSLLILCVILVGAHSFTTSDQSWSLFKNNFKKKYLSIEEELSRFVHIFQFNKTKQTISISIDVKSGKTMWR